MAIHSSRWSLPSLSLSYCLIIPSARPRTCSLFPAAEELLEDAEEAPPELEPKRLAIRIHSSSLLSRLSLFRSDSSGFVDHVPDFHSSLSTKLSLFLS